MVTIKNVASTGRYAEGAGLVDPGQTVVVTEEVADRICDGDNFARVDETPAPVDAQGTPPKRSPKTT